MKLSLTEIKLKFLGLLGAWLLALLAASLRWKKVVLQFEPKPESEHHPRLFVLWHNRQLMAPYVYNNLLPVQMRSELHALTSEHHDGRLIAMALEYNGMKNVAGSSTRGGKKALLRLIRILREEKAVAVTPDGPRGPIYQLKPGILKLAQASGLSIYSFAYGVKHAWRFKSWDKMILPKPFSPAVAVFSGPIKVPEQASREELDRLAATIENELCRITEFADKYEYA